MAAFPGDKRPCAALLYAVPGQGVDVEAVDAALSRQALALAADPVAARELIRARKAGLAGLYGTARSGPGLASLLAASAVARGTWAGLLDDLAAADGLTAADVEAAAGRVFAADGNCASAWAVPAADRVTTAPVLIA